MYWALWPGLEYKMTWAQNGFSHVKKATRESHSLGTLTPWSSTGTSWPWSPLLRKAALPDLGDPGCSSDPSNRPKPPTVIPFTTFSLCPDLSFIWWRKPELKQILSEGSGSLRWTGFSHYSLSFPTDGHGFGFCSYNWTLMGEIIHDQTGEFHLPFRKISSRVFST